MPLPTAPPQAPEIAEQRRADADLVRQARDGDAAAFATIMRRHNRLLFRTARVLEAEVKDLAAARAIYVTLAEGDSIDLFKEA